MEDLVSKSVKDEAESIDSTFVGVKASSQKEIRRVLVSSFVGATVEWYDFYAFSAASALVFGKLFFPQFDTVVGGLASFATLGVGFIARPIGGIVWGYFGDKVGRKKMLVSSIILMGAGTMLIGLLPTYAQIGIAAPILLLVLRIVQGISAGGEWGGAVLIAVEHDPKRRGFASSFPNTGINAGVLLSTGVFAIVATLPQDQLLSWGWRVPFLLSGILVVIGLWIRIGIHESPLFVAAQKAATARISREKNPLIQLLRNPMALIIVILLTLGVGVIAQVYTTFAISYGVMVGFNASEMTTVVLFGAVVGTVTLPIFGILSDRWGRKPLMLVGLTMQGICAYFLFAALNGHSLVGFYVAMGLISLSHSVCYGPVGAWISELFPTRMRYTGASTGYQVGSAILGFTPLILSALLIAGGGAPNFTLVLLFCLLSTVLGLTGALLAKETYKDSIAY
jgi:MFS family permease